MLLLCTISALTSTACDANPPGIKQTGYMCPVDEITADPDYVGTTGEGDYVKSTDTVDFTGASTGTGYFRAFPILIDKGSYTLTAVGGKGSKSWKESFTFVLAGMDEQQIEFATRMLNIPAVWICTDKNNKPHYIGKKAEPAHVETSEGSTGDGPEGERIITVTVSGYTARPMICTGAIDVTPAA